MPFLLSQILPTLAQELEGLLLSANAPALAAQIRALIITAAAVAMIFVPLSTLNRARKDHTAPTTEILTSIPTKE